MNIQLLRSQLNQIYLKYISEEIFEDIIPYNYDLI